MPSDLIFSLREVEIKFGKKIIFQNLDLNIHKKDMIALVGKNGVGKSTLSCLITAMLEWSNKYEMVQLIDADKQGSSVSLLQRICKNVPCSHYPISYEYDKLNLILLNQLMENTRMKKGNVLVVSAKDDSSAVGSVLKRPDVQTVLQNFYISKTMIEMRGCTVQFQGGQDAGSPVPICKATAPFAILVARHAGIAQVRTWATCA